MFVGEDDAVFSTQIPSPLDLSRDLSSGGRRVCMYCAMPVAHFGSQLIGIFRWASMKLVHGGSLQLF